jgi:hypothetical protein
MLYREKTEHLKTCPIKAGSVQFQVRVLKMGPYGGDGGNPTEMDVRGVDRIVKVVVWHDFSGVEAMSVVYERDGRVEETEQWGILPLGQRSEV